MRHRPAGALVGALAALSLAAAAVRAGRGVTKGSRIEHAEDLVLRNVVIEPLELRVPTWEERRWGMS